MPSGLRRFQQEGHLHFITFSCYRRQPYLDAETRARFERELERARRRYRFLIFGYVVMPEHVHLLVSEPQRESLAMAIKAMKLAVARRRGRFWQQRYYDFNVWTERKKIEKLRYIHRNPVSRKLVDSPEDWPWSSYRHYWNRESCPVQIESGWVIWERWKKDQTKSRTRVEDPG